MNVIKNFVMSGATYVKTGHDYGSFIMSGIEVYFEWIGASSKFRLLSFGEHYNYFEANEREEETWLAKKNGEWLKFSDGRLIGIDDMEYMRALDSCETQNYYIFEVARSEFEVTDKVDGCVYHYKERRAAFICEIDKCLVFDLRKRKCFVKYDLEFNELAFFEYDEYKSPSLTTQIGHYLFYCLLGSRHDFQVLDLRTFEVVAEYKDTGSTYLSAYMYLDVYYFFVGENLFIWKGDEVQRVDLVGDISAHLFLGGRFFVGFKNSPYLYLYDTQGLQALVKKKVVGEGYHPTIISSSSKFLGVRCSASSGNSLLLKSYFVPFEKSDFISDNEFEIEVEQPIYSEQEIYPEGSATFILTIIVDASHKYAMVVRHTLAIIKDAIERHSARVVAIPEDQIYSESFGGSIDFVFENSGRLDDKQKAALQDALYKIVNDARLTNKAYSQSEMSELRLNVRFI